MNVAEFVTRTRWTGHLGGRLSVIARRRTYREAEISMCVWGDDLQPIALAEWSAPWSHEIDRWQAEEVLASIVDHAESLGVADPADLMRHPGLPEAD